jgi:hypothetical protein
MSAEVKGQCLCGAVAIVTQGLKPSIGVCHCSICRNWTGGPFIAVEAVSEVQLIGEENIVRYDSSEWAQRGFCKNCGSNLFYYLKSNKQYVLLAGLFDLDESFKLDHQIFIDEKPEYYNFKEPTTCMTGAEVFAQYADTQDS